jgi:hypothetical protein
MLHRLLKCIQAQLPKDSAITALKTPGGEDQLQFITRHLAAIYAIHAYLNTMNEDEV